ncbi:MAG: DUF2818 family protein [Pelistega sp.]|nr:DUF2818 family protein [Pelistega sp.]
MYPETSVWLIIVLAIVCANLPFLTERMFAFVPLKLKGEPDKFMGYYLGRALLSYCFLGLAFYLLTHVGLPMVAKALGAVVFILLLSIPGFIYGKAIAYKNIGINLVELLVFASFVLAVGFFIESYYANRFTQSWQFYAISICIFVVLAFPGFSWRHLMRHPHLPKKNLE